MQKMLYFAVIAGRLFPGRKKIQKQSQKIIQLQIHIKIMIPLRIRQKILLEVNTS